jgi:hypothetical protein
MPLATDRVFKPEVEKSDFLSLRAHPGVHVVAQGGDGTADLIASMIRHRDFERETDPPMV